MKLLIAAPQSLGEVVCSTALFRCIKQQVAGVELHVWVAPQWATVVQHHPAIDRLHVAEGDQLAHDTGFDVLVDLRPSRELRQWAKAEGVRYLSIAVSFLVSFLSDRFGLYNDGRHHISSRYFEALKPLGVFDDGLGPDYYLGVADEVSAADIPAAQSAGYIALVTGEQDYDRPIPQKLLTAFCREVQHPLVLVSSRGFNNQARQLSSIDPVKIYNACGKFSLNETADLLRRARMVVCPETGLMQVAAAFSRPMLVWRSSQQPTAYFPPAYGQRLATAQPPRCVGWVWPSGALKSWKGGSEGELSAAAQKWLQHGLTLTAELLSART